MQSQVSQLGVDACANNKKRVYRHEGAITTAVATPTRNEERTRENENSQNLK